MLISLFLFIFKWLGFIYQPQMGCSWNITLYLKVMSIDTISIYDYDPLGKVSLTYLLVRKIKIIKWYKLASLSMDWFFYFFVIYFRLTCVLGGCLAPVSKWSFEKFWIFLFWIFLIYRYENNFFKKYFFNI